MSARHPERSAVIGLVAIALLIAGLARLDQLPLVAPDRRDYHAEFSDAGGLRPGDPVKVSGVVTGRVEGIEIAADRVVVRFELTGDVELGDETTATVGSGSLLGDKYLRVVPAGPIAGDAAALIPLTRTTAPYDVVDAFADLTTTTGKLDRVAIADALDTLSDTFADSPDEVRSALDGLSRFSAAVAGRDTDLRRLLDRADRVTGVLDRRKGDMRSLLSSTNLLLGELGRRRDAIHGLLVHTRSLADQLRAVVRENQAAITPALEDLDGVAAVLLRRQRELRQSIRNLDAYGRYYTDVVGSGPWFDNYIPRVPAGIQVGAQ